MKHYFFDVVGSEGSALDHNGRMLRTADEAHSAAELMALDLAVKQTDEVTVSEVTVSDAHGGKLFSIPVKESFLSSMPMAALEFRTARPLTPAERSA